MRRKERIAILTGGGDCAGINAVIRAVAKKAIFEHDMKVVGIADGYDGLIRDRHRMLHFDDVSGILNLGGTILGTSNTANPYRYALESDGDLKFKDVSAEAISNFRKLKADCLVCIGGDGTLTIADHLFRDGVPIVGVPKTIDNDIRGTDTTFGFDTAVTVATEAIDRVRTTAQSHHRVMIVEVMGRNAGWIALHAGVAGGAEIVLIPEIPYDINVIAARVKDRNCHGKRFTIVVVAEGARPRGGSIVVHRVVKKSTDPIRLGGIGFVLGQQIEEVTGLETRTVVLGHVQRGGVPTPYDRVLATKLGTKAVDMALKESFGQMVAIKEGRLSQVSLKEVAGGQRRVHSDNPLLKSARSTGICFGDIEV